MRGDGKRKAGSRQEHGVRIGNGKQVLNDRAFAYDRAEWFRAWEEARSLNISGSAVAE